MPDTGTDELSSLSRLSTSDRSTSGADARTCRSRRKPDRHARCHGLGSAARMV